MTDNKKVLAEFLAQAKPEQQFWALQDTKSEDWVVLDSLNYEETEVMPLWSTEALATKHCTEEWVDYKAAVISLADWLEFWVDDLLEDNIVVRDASNFIGLDQQFIRLAIKDKKANMKLLLSLKGYLNNQMLIRYSLQDFIPDRLDRDEVLMYL